jgi:hypothetical protein
MRSMFRIAMLALIVGGVGWWYFINSDSPMRRIADLEQKKRELEKIVSRLSADRRVAEFVVTGQQQVNGQTQTTILWEETNEQGARVASKSFTLKGDEVHIDALSIRFMDDFVIKEDPLRGHGLVLFTRLYGAHQTPAEGFAIDDPGQVVGVYRKDQPGSVSTLTSNAADGSVFERDLWDKFWRLVHDKGFREEKGVKVAGGKGVWIKRLDQGKVYTVSVDVHGNPTLDWEPIKPILREAMKQGK